MQCSAAKQYSAWLALPDCNWTQKKQHKLTDMVCQNCSITNAQSAHSD